MKPVIGVIPLWDDERESLWMLPGYFDGIRAAGGLPFMLPLTTVKEELVQLFELCDGLLLTGGHDVSPQLYGEEPIEKLGECCKSRDEMELQLLKLALAQDKPVLGICRGIQFINAAMGGSLYQDLPSQRPSSTEHHMEPPYDRACHKVIIKENSQLFDLLGVKELGVNSYHHQAVKVLAPGLEVMAEAEDGLIEAIRAVDKRYVWAVQWHPEFSYKTDINSLKILQSFVDATK